MCHNDLNKTVQRLAAGHDDEYYGLKSDDGPDGPSYEGASPSACAPLGWDIWDNIYCKANVVG